MTTKADNLQSCAWWSGANPAADECLNLALAALRASEINSCFELLRVAMTKYGWQFHSDLKARRLWDRWELIRATADDTHSSKIPFSIAVERLYHEMYRAVHFDANRRIRRNLPPSDPAARYEVTVPLAYTEVPNTSDG